MANLGNIMVPDYKHESLPLLIFSEALNSFTFWLFLQYCENIVCFTHLNISDY